MAAYSLSLLLLFAAARADPQPVVPYLPLEQPVLRSPNDVEYRAYQPGDDLKLVKKVLPVSCRKTSCWVAVASGTPTVVGVVEMQIPAKYIQKKVKDAIKAAMPEPSKEKPNGKIGYIEYVAVAKGWRGKGIAKELISKTFKGIGRTKPNVVAMYLWTTSLNKEAIGLYRSSKFVQVLREPAWIYFARYDMT